MSQPKAQEEGTDLLEAGGGSAKDEELFEDVDSTEFWKARAINLEKENETQAQEIKQLKGDAAAEKKELDFGELLAVAIDEKVYLQDCLNKLGSELSRRKKKRIKSMKQLDSCIRQHSKRRVLYAKLPQGVREVGGPLCFHLVVQAQKNPRNIQVHSGLPADIDAAISTMQDRFVSDTTLPDATTRYALSLESNLRSAVVQKRQQDIVDEAEYPSKRQKLIDECKARMNRALNSPNSDKESDSDDSGDDSTDASSDDERDSVGSSAYRNNFDSPPATPSSVLSSAARSFVPGAYSASSADSFVTARSQMTPTPSSHPTLRGFPLPASQGSHGGRPAPPALVYAGSPYAVYGSPNIPSPYAQRGGSPHPYHQQSPRAYVVNPRTFM